ncbi:MAG: hypothetical protein ACRD3S_14875, partial [Terracidiphilus sp.]
MRDDEVERLFVWKVRPNEREARGPETLPLSRADSFLIDCLEISMAWEQNGARGEGFGWDRRTGQRFRRVPPLSDAVREEFNLQSLLAVTIE